MEYKDELLARAEAHIFSTGLRDGATHLCRANMKYGLAKIHWVQERLGLKSDATFISSPDMTISRNAAKFAETPCQNLKIGGFLTTRKRAGKVCLDDSRQRSLPFSY